MTEKFSEYKWVNFVPDVVFHMRERDDSIGGDNPFRWVRKTTLDLFAGKKVLVFGLPGAFTPTCTNEQLPTFERMYDEFKEFGVEEIWCTSVNDAFAMYQWAQQLGIKNVKMLPDGNGDFAKGMGMLVDKSNLGFGKRSWRYAALINGLVIEKIWEEDGFTDNCPADPYDESRPENVYSALSSTG